VSSKYRKSWSRWKRKEAELDSKKRKSYCSTAFCPSEKEELERITNQRIADFGKSSQSNSVEGPGFELVKMLTAEEANSKVLPNQTFDEGLN